MERSEAFEQAISGGDRDTLRSFCETREATLSGSEEAETWAFLQTHFQPDGRRYLLERLGFSELLPVEPELEPEPAAAEDEAAAAAAAADQVQQLSLEQQAAAAAAAEQLLAGDGADFFEKASPTDGAAFFDNLASTPPRSSPLSPRSQHGGAGKQSCEAAPPLPVPCRLAAGRLWHQSVLPLRRSGLSPRPRRSTCSPR